MNLNESDQTMLQWVMNVYGHVLPMNRATPADVFADLIRGTYDTVDNEKNRAAYRFLFDRVRLGCFHKDANGIQFSHKAFTALERENGLREHYEKYLRYAMDMGIRFTYPQGLHGDMIDKAIYGLRETGDTALNFIPLRQWDNYHGLYRFFANRRLSPYPVGGWSLSDTVCTAKVACLRDALAIMLNRPIVSADDMIQGLKELEIPLD